MLLEEIVYRNKQALEERKRSRPFNNLERMAVDSPRPLDFALAIRGDGIGVIAEVERNPSSGAVIRDSFDPVDIARTYAKKGASAISVVTEPNHFQGSLISLSRIRFALMGDGVPLLRKDFITDPYQIYESRVYGADAVALVAAILSKKTMGELLTASHSLGMKCLVEVQNEKELDAAVGAGAGIICIDNHDPARASRDIDSILALRRLVPGDRTVVIEDGAKTGSDLQALERLDIDAVLVGEEFMTAADTMVNIKR